MYSFRITLLLAPLCLALSPVVLPLLVLTGEMWRALGKERALASDIKTQSCSLVSTSPTESTIRRFVQEKGERYGIPIPFQDVIIAYSTVGGVEKPSRIGYALPIEVTLFGVWTFPVFTHRDYQLCLNHPPRLP